MELDPPKLAIVVAEMRPRHQWVEFLRAGDITRGRDLLANEIDRRAPTYVDRPADITIGNWHTKKFSSTKGKNEQGITNES